MTNEFLLLVAKNCSVMARKDGVRMNEEKIYYLLCAASINDVRIYPS